MQAAGAGREKASKLPVECVKEDLVDGETFSRGAGDGKAERRVSEDSWV